jgi:hypothetical protein
MTFREDGTIEPIVYTLDEGVEITKSVNKRSRKKASPKTGTADAGEAVSIVNGSFRHQAEAFADQSGVRVEEQADGQQGQGLGYISNGDWTSYQKIDFGKNSATEIPFRVRASAQDGGGTIELRLDSLTGPIIGTIPVASTGSWNTYETFSTTLSGISGTHTLYLSFIGEAGNLMNLNWFEWAPVQ